MQYEKSCFNKRKGRRGRVDNLGKRGAEIEGAQAVQVMILLKTMVLRKREELSR
jgi:hypothetical protein